MIPQGNVVAQFGATWCQPCKAIRPFVETLAPAVGAKFAYFDMEKDHELANRLGIRALPTVVMFRDGAEVARVNGATRDKIQSAALAAFA